MIEIVCIMLLALGYRAFGVPDGREALRRASISGGARIDILLTDYWMPVMRGDELALRFRKACPAAGIILMSGNFPELLSVPDCEFLAKPFHGAALREKVHAALANGKKRHP